MKHGAKNFHQEKQKQIATGKNRHNVMDNEGQKRL